jgi:hypothetical protein
LPVDDNFDFNEDLDKLARRPGFGSPAINLFGPMMTSDRLPTGSPAPLTWLLTKHI